MYLNITAIFEDKRLVGTQKELVGKKQRRKYAANKFLQNDPSYRSKFSFHGRNLNNKGDKAQKHKIFGCNILIFQFV